MGRGGEQGCGGGGEGGWAGEGGREPWTYDADALASVDVQRERLQRRWQLGPVPQRDGVLRGPCAHDARR